MKAIILMVISLFLLAGAYADTAHGSVVVSGTPNITINNLTANSWHSSSFTINASISGAPIAAMYRWENSSANGSYTSLTYQGSGIWTTAFSITSIADGNYTFRINSTDAVSHTDNDTVFIYIDDTNPVISSFTLTKTSPIYTGSTLTSSDFSCAATDNSESFGGSVAVVITGLSTTTSGTKTATCTATDSAGSTATSTLSYAVVDFGGGGASGGGIEGEAANVTNKTTEAVILEKVPVERTISLTGFPKPIISIDVTAAQTIINSDIQVSILSSAEPVPSAKVFAYAGITTNVPYGAIKSASIMFEVDKSWLAENNFSPDSIILYMLVGGTWSALSTNRNGETADTYTYSATTPGFSTFAIAATIASPATGNAVTGSAISMPTIPLSTDTMVLGLMAVVLIAAVVIARMKSPKKRRY